MTRSFRNGSGWVAGVVALGLVAASGCGTTCDFAARCVGNTLETCGSVQGPGPIGAHDKISKVSCADSGLVCQSTGTNQAACVTPPQCNVSDSEFCSTDARTGASIRVFCNTDRLLYQETCPSACSVNGAVATCS